MASESLFRNSGFLIINLLFGAVCGYGATFLLTHLYSVRTVGLAATAGSASGLVAAVTQFGLNYSIPRFLPTTRHRASMINTLLTVQILAAGAGAVIFLLLPAAGKLYALGGYLFAAVFITATGVQAGAAFLGIVMVADRTSNKLARASTVPNLLKVAAPAAFKVLGAFGAYLSQIIWYPIGLFLYARALSRGGHRFRPELNLKATRELHRFSLGMYLAGLVGGLPVMVLPILVLARFGPSQSAYWSVAISIAFLLYQLPGSVYQALLPEASKRPDDRLRLMRRAAVVIVLLVMPTVAVAYVAAPFALSLFGSHYVNGGLMALRWLLIATLVSVLNYIFGAVLFLAKKTLAIAIVNIIDALIVIGLTLSWAKNVDGVAISWLVGDVGNTLLFGLFALLTIRQARGNWAGLGEVAVDPAVLAAAVHAQSQQQGLSILATIAESQARGEEQRSTRPNIGFNSAPSAAHSSSSPLGQTSRRRRQRSD